MKNDETIQKTLKYYTREIIRDVSITKKEIYEKLGSLCEACIHKCALIDVILEGKPRYVEDCKHFELHGDPQCLILCIECHLYRLGICKGEY